jgi:protein-tyrosine phosphatase
VIDLHCHVLAGIDDGPDTIEDSLAIARAALEAGIGTLVATPHVSWRYPNDAATIAELVDALNERLVAEGIAVDVRAGAEIAMTRVAEIRPTQLLDLRLGDGEWLLVEPPFTQAASGLDDIVLDLQSRGHRVLLAHPERCPAFHRNPRTLASLVDGGVLTSVTAGSLVGRFGDRARRFALELLQQEMVHNVASDAHDHVARAPGMAAQLEQVGLWPLVEWLTQDVPAAILGGEEIPSRPAVKLVPAEPPRRSWHLRR